MTLAPESELELLHQERRQAETRLGSLERAPREGRWTRGETEWLDAVANLEQRLRVLDQQITEQEALVAHEEDEAA